MTAPGGGVRRSNVRFSRTKKNEDRRETFSARKKTKETRAGGKNLNDKKTNFCDT